MTNVPLIYIRDSDSGAELCIKTDEHFIIVKLTALKAAQMASELCRVVAEKLRHEKA